MILREQERIAQQAQMDSLLLEGIESGDPVEATDDWWTQKRNQLIEQFQPASQTLCN